MIDDVARESMHAFHPISIPHEFEMEISLLVTENHRITSEAIAKREDEEIRQAEETWIDEDFEIRSFVISDERRFFEDLRHAANHSALVSLVTRLDHWGSKFVRQLGLPVQREDGHVVREIKALNRKLGCGPFPEEFFEKLVTARDSVVHGDSQGKWEKRSVAPEYVNAYDALDFTAHDLTEAVDKVIQQVKWYDDQIAALESPH